MIIRHGIWESEKLTRISSSSQRMIRRLWRRYIEILENNKSDDCSVCIFADGTVAFIL
nr:MAG TPA: hypothetical protein [Caudoviricetes sp.]